MSEAGGREGIGQKVAVDMSGPSVLSVSTLPVASSFQMSGPVAISCETGRGFRRSSV